ncbi:MAG: TIGR03619 family F420-dependent LLM class oxidoreductase [Actinomycetes bacterium]
MTTPQLSIGLPNFGSALAGDEWEHLLTVARVADETGIDRIVVVDHVVMGPHTDAYSWGRFPTPPDAPWLEPLTVLAYFAAITTRVRLATGILIAPMRGAAVLAKTAATLDVLSAGRLDLGVGTGWQREEYDAAGLDWSRRGQLLSDTLAACVALWRDVPAAVDLPTVRFSETYCVPQPLQRGGIPLWVSGTLIPTVADRIVRWGSGWIPIMNATNDDLRAGTQTLRRGFENTGRDPDTLQVRGALPVVRDEEKRPDLDRTLAGVDALVEAGATDIHLPYQAICRDPSEAPDLFAELVSGFRTRTG